MQYVAKPLGVKEIAPDDIQEPSLAASLERLIDRDGLDKVLETIGIVCWSKAVHLEETWQDYKSAKVWNKIGKSIDKLSIDCEGM